MQPLGTTLKLTGTRRRAIEHGLVHTKAARIALKAFGAAAKRERQRAGFTLSELSGKAGCSVSQLGNVEQGKNWPSMVLYLRLCKALGLPTPPLSK